jgi:hypothetical protein
VSTLEQRFGGSPADLARLRAGTPDASAVERVQTRLSGLERHLNGVRRRRWSARHVVVGTLRRTDFFIQRRLGDRRNPRLLQRYQAMRRRLRQLLFTPPSPPS